MLKLYRVTCRGMTSSFGGQPSHGIAYVVASDAEQAYRLHRGYLNRFDLGFNYERELDNVALVAENVRYPSSNLLLLGDSCSYAEW